MLKGSIFASFVVLALFLRAVAVPALSAFFGAIIGFLFPDATQGFLQGVGLAGITFWQFALIIGATSIFWYLGKPTTNYPFNKDK